MPAPVRLVLAFVCLPMLLIAQAERRPEDFQIAIGLQQRGLHDEAADYLERFLQQQPRHALGAEAQYRLAQARIELDQPDRAIAALRASLQLGGRDFALRAEARYRLGNLLEQKREHEAALQQFEALVAEVAAEHYLVPAAHYAAGEARRELGDDGAAAEAFTQAAKGATGERADFRFPALYQLGFARLRQREHERAVARCFAHGSNREIKPPARIAQGAVDDADRVVEDFQTFQRVLAGRGQDFQN
jgi:tetratricopeptide (TPR) repeat protein